MTEEERQEVTALPVPVHDAHPVDVGLLRAATPAEMVQVAGEIATPLAKVVEARKLYTVIGAKRHVHYEGWSTMLAMLGISPVENYSLRQKEDVEGAGPWYEASVDLIRLADGKIVGHATAECGSFGDTRWYGRPSFQKRSMAITRAAGKAARLSFSWIIEMAGFAGTPAEEMTSDLVSAPSTDPGPVSQEDGPPHPADGESPSAGASGGRELKAKRMASLYDGTCRLCGGVTVKGDDIAFGDHVAELADTLECPGRGKSAHWKCYADRLMKGAGQ